MNSNKGTALTLPSKNLLRLALALIGLVPLMVPSKVRQPISGVSFISIAAL
ncbi:hypothetical protein D3C71_2009500 [compost metagenome]